MKNTVKIFVMLFILMNYSCKAQQMVQMPNDAYKLKVNEQQFINKPLKHLLKEIKPEIKTVLGTIDNPSYFVFYFIDRNQLRKQEITTERTTLCIYVKEPLDWDFTKRAKGKEYLWTKEDIEEYGNLTVISIKVIGK